jgi:2-desacetyl-2-hydroxyethyl bacteriochlorophyllide A dehydrogenase
MSKRILFPSPGRAILEEFAPPAPAGPDDVLIETEFSIVSAGTELACRQGIESWAPLPFCPGYGSVGRIIESGPKAAAGLAAGRRVLTFGKHASHALADRVVIPVPGGLDPAEAVFARMASVAITALRVSDAELGDFAAVIGLGLVGNLAAQLFALAGCEVIGIDLSAARRRQAEACGIPHVLAPGAELRDQVAAITGGGFCGTVVDATGLSGVVISQAHLLAATQGEIILLGSPRAPHQADVTPFLSQLHLCRPVAQVKGALEWRYPVAADPGHLYKHSIERNVRQILRLLAQRKLKVAPLLTHRASPADCQQIYEGLAHQKDDYTGVVFDWSKV